MIPTELVRALPYSRRKAAGAKVLLIDLEGKVVHTWQMPYPPGNYGYLMERGTLFYNGKTPEDSERFISGKPWKGGAAQNSVGSAPPRSPSRWHTIADSCFV